MTNKVILLTMVLWGFLLAPACGGTYVYRPIPIDGGGMIQCVAISPEKPNLLLAGVDVAGIARSTAEGWPGCDWLSQG